MKRSKLFLIVASCLCVALAITAGIVALAYIMPKHQHVLGEAKTYHINNNGVYYTRLCKKGCTVKFNSEASLLDVMMVMGENESIILDEDVTLRDEIYVQTYIQRQDEDNGQPYNEELDLNVNINLNGHTLNINTITKQYNSLFMINANAGSINLNISNGKISSLTTKYLFRFKNNSYVDENIKVNLNNVDCSVSGIKATPLYMTECDGIELNATNCRFVSSRASNQDGDYGVGAFINSQSVFNFDNCYFEGGDGLYVKQGTVNLSRCTLVNSGLAHFETQGTEKEFSAIGSALTADSHTTSAGRTIFKITINDCLLDSKEGYKTIYITETKDAGLTAGVDSNSFINVISCSFTDDPLLGIIPQYANVNYPNGLPQIDGQVWVTGK